jgi:5-methylcytosine-specific restriction endonuclease McrA
VCFQVSVLAVVPADAVAYTLPLWLFLGAIVVAVKIAESWLKDRQREQRRKQRRTFYNEKYLKSDDWQRKRAVVLTRDKNRCVYCGARASQVHHKRYAPRNIGREPIEWLVSVCEACHRKQHKF